MKTSDPGSDFLANLKSHGEQTTAFLDRHFAAGDPDGLVPRRLVDAIRHGVLNGGKRFRPFLVLEVARLFGSGDEAGNALPVAAALECIHCYSLIHDDLPAMDDDDMRRGQPTVHKAFDEATAILAGDALLTEAFAIVSDPEVNIGYESKCAIIGVLAAASGLSGMVGGQMFDLMNENKNASETMVVRTQAMKTGALIRAACEVGSLAGGGSPEDRARLAHYGEIIGLAFQLADDLLDETSNMAAMGKQTGKDAAAGKRTLISIHGQDWARNRLGQLVEEAHALLEPYGEKAVMLREAARFVAERGN